MTLTEEERLALVEMISRGKGPARKLCHSRILLKADAGPQGPAWQDQAISEALEVGTATIERVRKRFVEEGFEEALGRKKPRREYERRLAEKLEIHYTPKHGSWLDMAEIELGILNRQCLNRRLSDARTLQREVALWENDRNQRSTKVNWRFTTVDARVKLRRLYPSID